jgi:Ca-activated chloride channel family protein
LHKIIKQTLSPSYVKIHLLDINNKPTETNLNISFINNFTEQSEYEIVHYLDQSGKTDAIKVDPILTYDIIVNSIPKVIKEHVEIQAGNNLIEIKTPQGMLGFDHQNKSEYKNTQAIIKQHLRNEVLNIQNLNSIEKYLVGNYDIEVLTMPRLKFDNIKINQSVLKTLTIPSPGWLHIAENHNGFGSIYQILSNGKQEWIYNLENQSSKIALQLLPGNYKFVFRSSNSKGSEYTISKKISIKSGLTTTLKLY